MPCPSADIRGHGHSGLWFPMAARSAGYRLAIGTLAQMKYRKLRITWSVVWGLAVVLLVVLWIGSYSRTGYLERQSTPPFFIQSQRGQLTYMSGLPDRIRLGLLSGQMHFDAARASSPPVC